MLISNLRRITFKTPKTENTTTTTNSITTMNPITLFFSFSLFFPHIISSQPCKPTCGSLQLHYPFGSGPGCGDPLFQDLVSCNSQQQQLIFKTQTGNYIIQSIDYTNNIIYINDPSMSTCNSMQTSQGFGLDWNAPFTFLDTNVFALLDCSTTSSPLYKPNNPTSPLCDTSANGVQMCSLLYSCPGIGALNLSYYSPVSTCCIYSPVDLGPSFGMDLHKLKCASYVGVYGFDSGRVNPEEWKYGIALKYRFNVDNSYPSACAACERSNGVCGYMGNLDSFICNCASGVNSTSSCYFTAFWSHGVGRFAWIKGSGIWLMVLWVLSVIASN